MRHVVTSPELSTNASSLVRGTVFDRLPREELDRTIDLLQEYLNDQAVLSLYAAFESEIRGHLIAQSVHLTKHARSRDIHFAQALAEEYSSWCDEGIRMDRVAAFFKKSAGQTLLDQIGQVRKYRHWLAHGKRRQRPSNTTPVFAYEALNEFLSKV